MIDWARVKQLQDEVGAEDFDEVVDLFMEEVEVVMKRIADQTERSQLGQDLHFLKGSALSLGFGQFANLCHHGEIAGGKGEADTINLAQIFQCFSASKDTFLKQYRQQLAA